ncbi:MAG TPA: hypothetical protein VFR55_07945 [Dehalococcoidia bacterium]|nr:hypothetical protein [Dehalococcoidia bacterium]
MGSLHKNRCNSIRGRRLSPVLVWIVLLLAATLLIACNPFSDHPDPLPGEPAPGKPATEETSPQLAEMGLERVIAATEKLGAANADRPTAEPDPSPTPTNIPIPAATVMATADEARNQVWAYLTQCVSININDLEARQIQGEWFVQAAGESPDQYGLWKVDPNFGLVQAHNIRARQWEPLVNQNCTPEQFNGFFTPTPSPLRNSEVTEAPQAVTILWATLVNCYPNMETGDLQATLDPARGEWVVTANTDVSSNYGVWAVASDGTVSPKNRQAQGVFDQLDSGLC